MTHHLLMLFNVFTAFVMPDLPCGKNENGNEGGDVSQDMR